MTTGKILGLVVGTLGVGIVLTMVLARQQPNPKVDGGAGRDLAAEAHARSEGLSGARAHETGRLSVEPTTNEKDPLTQASVPSTELPLAQDRETEWTRKYKELTVEALRKEQLRLNEEISEKAAPELSKRFESGHYVVLHKGARSSAAGGEWDPNVVMGLRLVPASPTTPEGETQKVVLPESEFPHLYSLRDEERWIEKRISQVKLAARSGPAPQRE